LKTFNIILNFSDIIGPVFAVVIFLFNIKKMTKELWVVMFFCIVQIVCNGLATYIDYVIHGNNYWVYKINTLLSFAVIIVLFVGYLLPFEKKKRILVYSILIAITAILVISDRGFSSFNSHGAAMASILIVGYCLYFFYIKLIRSSPEESITSKIIFWCVVGIFTYYAGAFFIFISYKYLLISDISAVTILWRFHNLLLLICCVYISYGVLCKESRKIL
jgi:hypothetical protein